ncbi:MAG: hypothetical protein M4579_001010 [Chaenotheca gracillima]|nr:MAG: hypothetical protein M4579_001010 [Chaenotheca gracillima]
MSTSNRHSQVFSTRYLEGLASTDSLSNPPPYGLISKSALFEGFPSRTSSIISTGTRTTLDTLIDESPTESFDVQVRGGLYRVGLNGQVVPGPSRLSGGGWRSSFEFTDHQPYDENVGPQAADLADPRRGSSAAISLLRQAPDRTGSLPVHVMPSRESRPSTPSDVSPMGVSRAPSYTPGKENLSVVRTQSASSLGTTSRALPVNRHINNNMALTRRGGVRLKITTREIDGQQILVESGPSSAESYETAASHSPDGFDQGASEDEDFPHGESSNGGPNAFLSPLEDDAVGPNLEAVREKLKAVNLNRRADETPKLDKQDSDASVTGSSKLEVPGANIAVANKAHDPVHLPPAGVLANRRHELEDRDHDSSQMRQMIAALARQVIELKTELVRTKSQVTAISASERKHHLANPISPPPEQGPDSPPDAASQPALSRLGSTEGHSFHFPPLKLNDIKTLKTALKRRAEKIRRGIGDDFGRTPHHSISSTSGVSLMESKATDDLASLADQQGRDVHTSSVSEDLHEGLEDVEEYDAYDLEEYIRNTPPLPDPDSPGSLGQIPSQQQQDIWRLQELLQKSQQTTAFYAARCQELEIASKAQRQRQEMGW